MAYERDADAMHHGVGAIAAVDAVTSARRYRTAVRNQRLRAKDKRRARLTYGPRGGMGAISLTSSPGIPPANLSLPVPPSTRPFAASGLSRANMALFTAEAPSPIQIALPPSSTTWGAAPASGTSQPGSCDVGYVMTSQGCIQVVVPPSITTTAPPPTMTPRHGTPSPGGGGGGNGGGGGGGVGTPTVPGTPLTVTPVAPNPELEDTMAPAATAPADTSTLFTPTNILIGIAALGAAYLLFGKKGG